jgi:hypothetical protein
MAHAGWILELDDRCWKADCGVTVLIENAKRYETISKATAALAIIRQRGRYYRNAKINHDGEEEAKAEGKEQA